MMQPLLFIHPDDQAFIYITSLTALITRAGLGKYASINVGA